MKGDWAKIMNLVKGVKKISDTYLQDYGELGAPRRSWWIRLSIIEDEW
jgi:hypothetical protein